MVELGGLLLIEGIDVGVVAIGVGAALDDERSEASRGVAKGGAGCLDDPALELLVRISLEKGGPLERPELGADAHREKIVEHRLTKI